MRDRILFPLTATLLAVALAALLLPLEHGRIGVERGLAPPLPALPLPQVDGPPNRALVVIDAGHGGHDPGARAADGTSEKDVTLALALAARDALLRQGRWRVALTRGDDRYLLLGERSAIARRLGAALFVSLHADSAAAGDASGATIYALSDRPSDSGAAAVAERENRIGGVDLSAQEPQVSAILLDLARRETRRRSDGFARQLHDGAGDALAFRPDWLRSADFVVLRSPDLPSVLVEVGYLSSAADAARLSSPAARTRFADGFARAVDVYLARQQPR